MSKRKQQVDQVDQVSQVDQYFDNMWLVVACQQVPNLAKLLGSMTWQGAYFANVRIVAKRCYSTTQQVLVIADLKNAPKSLDNYRPDDVKTGHIFKHMFRNMTASLADQSGLIFGIKLASNLAHECANKHAIGSLGILQPGQKVWLVFSFNIDSQITRHIYYTIKSNLANNLHGAARLIQHSNAYGPGAKFSSLNLLSVRWARDRARPTGLFGKCRKTSDMRNSSFYVLALATISDIQGAQQDAQTTLHMTAETIGHAVSSSTGWCFDYDNHGSDCHYFQPKLAKQQINQRFHDMFDERNAYLSFVPTIQLV